MTPKEILGLTDNDYYELTYNFQLLCNKAWNEFYNYGMTIGVWENAPQWLKVNNIPNKYIDEIILTIANALIDYKNYIFKLEKYHKLQKFTDTFLFATMILNKISLGAMIAKAIYDNSSGMDESIRQRFIEEQENIQNYFFKYDQNRTETDPIRRKLAYIATKHIYLDFKGKFGVQGQLYFPYEQTEEMKQELQKDIQNYFTGKKPIKLDEIYNPPASNKTYTPLPSPIKETKNTVTPKHKSTTKNSFKAAPNITSQAQEPTINDDVSQILNDNQVVLNALAVEKADAMRQQNQIQNYNPKDQSYKPTSEEDELKMNEKIKAPTTETNETNITTSKLDVLKPANYNTPEKKNIFFSTQNIIIILLTCIALYMFFKR